MENWFILGAFEVIWLIKTTWHELSQWEPEYRSTPHAAKHRDNESTLTDHLVAQRKKSLAWRIEVGQIIFYQFDEKAFSYGISGVWHTFFQPLGTFLRAVLYAQKLVLSSEGKSKVGVCVDLFPHMLHIIAPRLMACSNLCRGTVPSVDLSVPVVTLSCAHAFYLPWLVCPSCWRSPLSILLEAP